MSDPLQNFDYVSKLIPRGSETSKDALNRTLKSGFNHLQPADVIPHHSSEGSFGRGIFLFLFLIGFLSFTRVLYYKDADVESGSTFMRFLEIFTSTGTFGFLGRWPFYLACLIPVLVVLSAFGSNGTPIGTYTPDQLRGAKKRALQPIISHWRIMENYHAERAKERADELRAESDPVFAAAYYAKKQYEKSEECAERLSDQLDAQRRNHDEQMLMGTALLVQGMNRK